MFFHFVALYAGLLGPQRPADVYQFLREARHISNLETLVEKGDPEQLAFELVAWNYGLGPWPAWITGR